jgi:hypothetical protein
MHGYDRLTQTIVELIAIVEHVELFISFMGLFLNVR